MDEHPDVKSAIRLSRRQRQDLLYMCRCVFLSRWRGAKPRQYTISVWDTYLYALNTNPRNCLSMSYYLGALAGFYGMEIHEEGKQTLAQKLIDVLKARYSRAYLRDFTLFAFIILLLGLSL